MGHAQIGPKQKPGVAHFTFTHQTACIQLRRFSSFHMNCEYRPYQKRPLYNFNCFFFSSSFTFNGGSITNQHKIQFSFMSKTKQYFYRIQLCQCAFDNAIFEWLLFQVSFSFFGFLFFKFYSFNRNYNKRNKEIWFCIRCTHNRCT